MIEEEIKEKEDKMKEAQRAYWEKNKHAERIAAIRFGLPEPKGFFKKKCPKCGGILVKRGFRDCSLYTCKCGYEYAERSSNE